MNMKNKYAAIKDSYESNFKYLNSQELDGLKSHMIFLDKVHREIIGSEEESSLFKDHLNAFLSEDGKEFFSICQSAYIDQEKIDAQKNFLSRLSLEKVSTGRDLIPIVKKLSDKNGDLMWGNVKNVLFENESGDLRETSLRALIEGFSFDTVTTYHRFLEAVNLLVHYLNNVFNSVDYKLILNICKTNEKFAFLLLYPYFLKCYPEQPLISRTSGRFKHLLQEYTKKKVTVAGFVALMRAYYKTLCRVSKSIFRVSRLHDADKEKWRKETCGVLSWTPIGLNEDIQKTTAIFYAAPR